MGPAYVSLLDLDKNGCINGSHKFQPLSRSARGSTWFMAPEVD